MVARISTGSPFEEAFGYSRAVIDGDMVYVSGTTGYDYTKMAMPGDAGAQAANALGTIADVLESAGASLRDVVRVRYYLADAGYQDAVGRAAGRAFKDIRPAATMVICGLIREEMKVEIEVTARIGANEEQA